MSGLSKALPDDVQMEAILNIMVSEAMKTSEIEGEYLSRPDVISCIRNNLGLNQAKAQVKYISITKVSKATATRDLQILTEAGALISKDGGRSTTQIIFLNIK